MGFGKGVVQLERFACGVFGVSKILPRRSYAVYRGPVVVISDADIRLRVIGIEANCFPKLFERLLKTFISELVPEETPFEISLVGGRVFCLVSQQQFALFTGQTRHKRLRDLFGY